MRCIDLFAGAGGFSEGAKGAGLEVVWAANHWPAAVSVHSANHPDTEHLCQDLHQASWPDVPEHDILLASPCCIPEDGQVVMADGTSRPIGSLKVGDAVLTGQGRGGEVVNVWRKLYSGAMLSFRLWGDSKHATVMTADHPVWIRRRGGKYFKFGDPMFVKAEEVRPGDYVAFPVSEDDEAAVCRFVSGCLPGRVAYSVKTGSRAGVVSSLPGGKVAMPALSEDLWWLLGHYLGDGQTRKDRYSIGWSVGNSEENLAEVRARLARLGLRSWIIGKPGNQTVFADSKHLHALCLALGGYAHTKFIPAELLRLPKHLAVALMDGYLAADGSEKLGRANPMSVATSVSLPLLQSMQRLCWHLGWSASISLCDYARKRPLEGRIVQCRDSWTIQVIRSPHRQSRTKFMDGYAWRSVRSVAAEDVVSVPVVDIEVSEDHTFCLASGVVVHNCQGHSRARGKDRQHHDAARSTAWAVVSAAECHRPKAVVVENVPEFALWSLFPAWAMAMESLGYTLRSQVLDAQFFGVPQMRKRLFIVATRAKKGFDFHGLGGDEVVPVSEALDLQSGDWNPWEPGARAAAGVKPLVPATMARIEAGLKKFGAAPFWVPYFGSNVNGFGIDRPIWTITTRDRYALVVDGQFRVLTVAECRRIMGFPEDYALTGKSKVDKMLLGNAVCPPVAQALLKRLAAVA